jgi:hypothetical protein
MTFSREAVRGEQNASFYSAQTRQMSAQAPPRPEFAELRKSGFWARLFRLQIS